VNTLNHIKDRYRYSAIILKQLVVTDFKLRYKGSVLGYLWTLLRPLALFAVLYVVFVNFLRFGDDIPHYPVYLLLGVVLWSYFVEVTVNGVTSIVGKGDLMRKLSFPRYVVVIAGSVSALINLASRDGVCGNKRG
jgi:ABC-2 type transport system permease protein